MRAIQVTAFGGPEVLVLREVPEPVPGPGQVLVDVEAAGGNFAETMQTRDAYVARTTLPFVPGSEVVGRTADGRRLLGFSSTGAYAERALLDERTAAPLPEDVPAGVALALLVQGVTAALVLGDTGRMQQGDTVLVHAGAGGVGSLAIQLARRRGAGHIVATASTSEKRSLVLRLGADEAVDSAAPDLAAALQAAAGNRRYDLILDGVAGPAFTAGLRLLHRRGRIVVYGAAGGDLSATVDPVALIRGSRTVAGFWLVDHLDRVPAVVGELLGLLAEGAISPIVGGGYPLAEARRAHEDLLGRRTEGKLILTP
ncbi:MAG: quinone oxidoreductase family protein [Amnibacterium sp.]